MGYEWNMNGILVLTSASLRTGKSPCLVGKLRGQHFWQFTVCIVNQPHYYDPE
jgi:hypothetical protein